MNKKNLTCLILFLILSMSSITEANPRVYIGPWSGWWGHPHRWGGPSFNLFFSKRINGRIYLGASLPLNIFQGWSYDYRYYYPYGYYYPYYYGKIIENNPEPVEDYTPKNSYATNPTEKDQDVIFYGGIQIHPAGRIKIITTNKGFSSGVPAVAKIEIDGFPAGKTGTEGKPFEMGLLVGKHKVVLKKDGKEVFSAEVDVERNKEVSLKIDLGEL